MLASSGVYMATLRQLEKRPASMGGEAIRGMLGDGDGFDGGRSGELTGWCSAMASATRGTMRTMVKEKGRLRAFWEARALPSRVRGPVGTAGVSGPRGRPGGETFGEVSIGGDIARGQGEGRGGRR